MKKWNEEKIGWMVKNVKPISDGWSKRSSQSQMNGQNTFHILIMILDPPRKVENLQFVVKFLNKTD